MSEPRAPDGIGTPLDLDAPPAPVVRGPTVVPVSLLVNTARLVVERHLPLMWVAGEISNFSRAGSGHCYFSLKDESAQVRCVLFRQKAQLLDLPLRNGLHVEVRACATIYEARGEFQLSVEAVRLGGLGQLYEAFSRLKAKLEAQGWFAAERKRPLPVLPRRVGVVTSPAGAAIRDVLTTLARRFASIPVVVYPVQVQGPGAARQVADAIALANRRGECDVLIVCRGGGSIEDLWAFNEEVVARAVYRSAIPIVSGVGHETDFTICDFVADVRAATPTAAAASVVPECAALAARANALARRLRSAIERRLEQAMQRADDAGRRLVHPAQRIDGQRAALAAAARRLGVARSRLLERCESRLERVSDRFERLSQPAARALPAHHARAGALVRAASRLVAERGRKVEHLARSLALLDPRAVLERGYGLVTDGSGRVVPAADALAPGQVVRIEFARDHADAQVLRTGPNDRD